MSPLATAALVGPLLVAAACCVVMSANTSRRSVADVRAVLHAGGPMSTTTASRAPIRRSFDGAVARHFGPDLAIADLTADAVATRILTGAGAVGSTVALARTALAAIGASPATPWWLLLVVVAAGMAAAIVVADVRATVERRRRAMRRATNDFVQLLAVGLTTDQSVEEAVRFALGAGRGVELERLRDELDRAPLRGVSLWEAIDEIGDRYDQRELCELATSIERQGTQGVSIVDTVTSLATAMRERALDDLERDADRANANLVGPTIAFVCTTIVFLAFPLAIRISDAFGS